MIYVKVAEKTFAVETTKQKAMLALMANNYTPFFVEAPSDDEKLLYSINIDRPITLPLEAPVKQLDYLLTEDSASLRIYPERYILTINNKQTERNFSIDCRTNSGNDSTEYLFESDLTIQGVAPPLHIIDHLLIFALSLAGIAERILLIHASTIVNQGKAVMFLAESGTGKSTHTRMWLENIPNTYLLNDDAPALRISSDGAVYAYGTPWSGKTPCYKNEQHPLAAMVRICRAPYNKITRQNMIASFGAILPSCLPTLQQDDNMLDAMCETISQTIKALPIYTLECLPNPEAAQTSFAALFAVNK